MEGMKDFPDKFFDLAIVDPPYGIGISKNELFRGNKPCKEWQGRHKTRKYKIKEWDNQVPTKEYFNELKRISKDQILWGANHYISLIPYNSSCWIVWDKKVTDYSADCELAWTSFKTAVRKFEYLWNGYKKQIPEIRFHPTQKPIALYKWLLKNYAKPDFKIIDTHAGSCSSVIAFLEFGCQWIAFEIDKDYYQSALKRIENHKAQLKLSL